MDPVRMDSCYWSRIMNGLSSASNTEVTSKLIEMRSFTKSFEWIVEFHRRNGIPLLLINLDKTNPKIIDVTLSILGNICFINANCRETVIRLGGVAKIMKIVNCVDVPSVQVRAFRTLANLAVVKKALDELQSSNIFYCLPGLLGSNQTEEMHLVCIRCTRSLSVRAENVAQLVISNSIFKITKIFVETKSDQLFDSCLKCILTLSSFHAVSGCIEQMKEAGGLITLFNYCRDEAKLNGGNFKMALKTLCQMAHCEKARETFGPEGVLLFFISSASSSLDSGEYKSDVFIWLIEAVCLCAKDAVSRGKMRECQLGLPLLINVLNNTDLVKLHDPVVRGLMEFIYDELGLTELLEMNLIGALCKQIEIHLLYQIPDSCSKPTSPVEGEPRVRSKRPMSYKITSPSYKQILLSDMARAHSSASSSVSTLPLSPDRSMSPSSSCGSSGMSPAQRSLTASPLLNQSWSPTSRNSLSPISTYALSPITGNRSPSSDGAGVEAEHSCFSPTVINKHVVCCCNYASQPNASASKTRIMEWLCPTWKGDECNHVGRVLMIFYLLSFRECLPRQFYEVEFHNALLMCLVVAKQPMRMAARILLHLSSDRKMFQSLISCGFVDKVVDQLLNFNGINYCKKMDLKDLGWDILKMLSGCADSDFGTGEIGVILKGPKDEKEKLAISVILPYILKSKKHQQVMFLHYNALKFIMDYLRNISTEDLTPNNTTLHKITKAVSMIATKTQTPWPNPTTANQPKRSRGHCQYIDMPKPGDLVTFSLMDGSTLPASRSAMSQTCDYFGVLLEGGFREAKSENVALKDMTLPALEQIVHFLSDCDQATCQVRDGADINAVLDTIVMADRILLPELKAEMGLKLNELLLPENLQEVYSIGMSHNNEFLCDCVVEYLLSDRISDGARLESFVNILEGGCRERIIDNLTDVLKENLLKE